MSKSDMAGGFEKKIKLISGIAVAFLGLILFNPRNASVMPDIHFIFSKPLAAISSTESFLDDYFMKKPWHGGAFLITCPWTNRLAKSRVAGDYNTAACIFSGNDMDRSIETGLIRPHMPGVK